jgi:hypothetical protein
MKIRGIPASFTPIPALISLMVVLYFTVKPTLFYEPVWLLPVTNTLFVTVVCLLVAYIALRNYRATGRIQILLLGCGVLAFGIGGVVAGFLRDVPGIGANLNVTIYNTGALAGGAFHFVAALILVSGPSPRAGARRRPLGLVLGYGAVTLFMRLFTPASVNGIIPPFFIRGTGPTILRQWILGAAGLLFAFDDTAISNPGWEACKMAGPVGHRIVPDGYRPQDLRAMEAVAPAIVQAFIRTRAERELKELNATPCSASATRRMRC